MLLDELCGTPVEDMTPASRDLLMSRCVEDIPDGVYALFWARADAAAHNETRSSAHGGDVLGMLTSDVEYAPPEGQQPEPVAGGSKRGAEPDWTTDLKAQYSEFCKNMPTEGKDVVLRQV